MKPGLRGAMKAKLRGAMSSNFLKSWFWVSSPAFAVALLYTMGMRVCWQPDTSLYQAPAHPSQGQGSKSAPERDLTPLTISIPLPPPVPDPPKASAPISAASPPAAVATPPPTVPDVTTPPPPAAVKATSQPATTPAPAAVKVTNPPATPPAEAANKGTTPPAAPVQRPKRVAVPPVLNDEIAFTIRRPQTKSFSGCGKCCSNGEDHVACFDVEKCADSVPPGGKFALVMSQVWNPSSNFLPFLSNWKEAAEMIGNTDLVMMVPKRDEDRLQAVHHKRMKDFGVRLVITDWAVPPDFKFFPKTDWCGHQDFVRLNAFGLEGYDAVAYYDSDIEFQGDISPVLRCASTGMFLSTGGGVGEPLNVGFFALRPSPQMLEAARIFGRKADYNDQTGWGNAKHRPSNGGFIGSECGQGFVHTLFYHSKSPLVAKSLEEAGLGTPGNWAFKAVQIDRCLWNYQTSHQCRRKNFCYEVRAHHKPNSPRGSDPTECEKFDIAKKRQERTKKPVYILPVLEPPVTTLSPEEEDARNWEKTCKYHPDHPGSSRDRRPCIPPFKKWPYDDRNDFKIAFGERILAAVSSTTKKAQCGRYEYYGDYCWCTAVFEGAPEAGAVAVAIGIGDRDTWSEKMANVFELPSILHDCYVNLKDSPLMAGKVAVKKSCRNSGDACYEKPYTPSRVCLRYEVKKIDGRQFGDLKMLLQNHTKPLSVHLKIDVDATEWTPLRWLMDNPEEADKLRSLDIRVHFGQSFERASEPGHEDWSYEESTNYEVEILEDLATFYIVAGSTLEVNREGYNENDCSKSNCQEPTVYLAGGYAMQNFWISFVNRKLLK